MDGVIADFDKGVLNTYRNRHPNKPFIPLEQRTTFYVKKEYPKELQPLVEEIYLSKGFYLNLPPVTGSLKALDDMTEKGNEVFICTSPLLENPFCISEKYDWITKHLGDGWTKRVITSKDKTLIHGRYLIDDKPYIKGIRKPNWEHVLYSQPYNRNVSNKRRLDWNNWENIIR